MNKVAETIGEICKVVFPIPEEFFLGNPKSKTAICTLGSLNLLKSLKNSNILDDVGIIGRLLSENKGIDELVRNVNRNKNIKKIILCGKEVWGHKAGHSLLKLKENGIDSKGRIINSISPDPILTVSKTQIEYFRKEITLVNMIDETNFEKIKKLI